MNRHHSVHEREAHAGDDGAEQAHRPRAELVGAEHAEERAREHHPLEPDIDDTAALADQSADRRIGQGRRPGSPQTTSEFTPRLCSV